MKVITPRGSGSDYALKRSPPQTPTGPGVWSVAEDCFEHGTMRRSRCDQPSATVVSDLDEHPSPVEIAHRPTDQIGALETRDQPRQRALAEMGGVGKLLHPVVVLAAFDHVIEDLELTRAEVVLVQLALQRRPSRSVLREQVTPCPQHGRFVHDLEGTMHEH